MNLFSIRTDPQPIQPIISDEELANIMNQKIKDEENAAEKYAIEKAAKKRAAIKEAAAEKEVLVTQLREILEGSTGNQLMEDEANESDLQQTLLNKVPLKIYIG